MKELTDKEIMDCFPVELEETETKIMLEVAREIIKKAQEKQTN